MAASERHPTGTPRSTTGSWEISFFSMISTARETGSWGPTLYTGVCITSRAR
jgi:hypothetical protein